MCMCMHVPGNALNVCAGTSMCIKVDLCIWLSSQGESVSHFVRLVDLWLSLIMSNQGQAVVELL